MTKSGTPATAANALGDGFVEPKEQEEGGSSVMREARDLLALMAPMKAPNELERRCFFTVDALVAALVAATARAERAHESAELLRSVIAKRTDLLRAAEARAAELETALTDLGWDIGEAELCWCPEHWWGIEPDTGAQRNEEHSPNCIAARHVLVRRAPWKRRRSARS